MQTKPIIILGMHRSGTSCLAGSLQRLGLYFGDVNIRAEHNPFGNRENREIMLFHDELLNDNKGSWENPPDTVIWSKKHKDICNKIITSYPSKKTWGFKDPRTILAVEGWLEILPLSLFVGTFRHPYSVANSLHRRNQFDFEKGISLWVKYNRALLEFRKNHQFQIICFDLSESSYLQKLSQISESLGLGSPNESNQFFSDNLRSSRNTDLNNLTEEASEIYTELLKLSKC